MVDCFAMFTYLLYHPPSLFSLDKSPKNKYFSSRRLYWFVAKINGQALDSRAEKEISDASFFSAFEYMPMILVQNFLNAI